MQGLFDPLWVPILSHYSDATGELQLDRVRVRCQLSALLPYVRQYLVAGTTGDGWQMSEAILRQWLELVTDPNAEDLGQTVIVGALGPDAAAVIRHADMIERYFRDRPTAMRFAGLAVCPPICPGADDAIILRHFRDVLAATSAPIAVYQLPQITGCEISPAGFAELAAENPRILLFKDTSGDDRVANARLPTGQARLLRGAEGHYSHHLAPAGRYHGWLLSTANGFASELRAIAEAVQCGQQARADSQSEWLARIVSDLFAEAAGLGGNTFADTNRAVDHLRAFGDAWRTAPTPLRADGTRLPSSFLASVEARMKRDGVAIETGYLR